MNRRQEAYHRRHTAAPDGGIGQKPLALSRGEENSLHVARVSRERIRCSSREASEVTRGGNPLPWSKTGGIIMAPGAAMVDVTDQPGHICAVCRPE
jgi:hypothetical protein